MKTFQFHLHIIDYEVEEKNNLKNQQMITLTHHLNGIPNTNKTKSKWTFM